MTDECRAKLMFGFLKGPTPSTCPPLRPLAVELVKRMAKSAE